MMYEKDLDYVLKEHFDTSNRKSIRNILSLNEADQSHAMAALAAKLYEKIVAKVDDIDYGTIPASKGDITKIGNYMELRDCITTINEILVHYKQDTYQLDIIDKAIENIKTSKATWEKGFAVKSELPITFYNTIVLSIVSSVSLLISSSIDFIKEPGSNSFTISFDRVGYNKTKDKLLFQNLAKFNDSFAKGDIQKMMDNLVKSNVKLNEAAEMYNESVTAASVFWFAAKVGSVVFLLKAIKLVIPILHQLTSALYCAKQNVSDYFELQSKLVQFNAEQLKYDYTKSEAEIKKIYDKQMKIASVFKKISDAFAVKMNKAESEARKQIEKDREEKYDDTDLEISGSSIF